MTITPISVSVNDAVKMTGISRTKLFHALGEGQIESRMFGRRRLVLTESLRRFIEGLPQERLQPHPSPRARAAA